MEICCVILGPFRPPSECILASIDCMHDVARAALTLTFREMIRNGAISEKKCWKKIHVLTYVFDNINLDSLISTLWNFKNNEVWKYAV